MERFFLFNNFLVSNHYLIIQKVHLQFLLYKFYAKASPLIEMFPSLKVAKKDVHVYCFQEKHNRGLLETDNLAWKL